jgi:ferredoxin
MARFYFLPILSSILLAAHFSRVQQDGLALAALLFPLILLIKRAWIRRIYQLYLIFGGLVWIERLAYLRSLRISEGRPWIRLAAIPGAVALVTFLSVLPLEKDKLRRHYSYSRGGSEISHLPSLSAFLLTAGLLIVLHFQVDPPILLLERFVPGLFGIEILALALYAAWISEKMLDPSATQILRSRIWTLFSLVFFAQFILGISGFEQFLMTGKLHLPIPAMIVAGPLFRGQDFYMLILFSATVLLVGTAWCSHLCYIGSWDNLAGRARKRPGYLPESWRIYRIGIFMLIILAAPLFRWLRVASSTATGVALLYGLTGVGVMLFVSRRNGLMTHCTIYCPIGLAADVLGRISPFRIRFTASCNGCGACRSACRYHALEPGDIEKKRPGLSCTLCGDCLPACPETALEYKFLGLPAPTARRVFLVLIISLHAVFLGVARL